MLLTTRVRVLAMGVLFAACAVSAEPPAAQPAPQSGDDPNAFTGEVVIVGLTNQFQFKPRQVTAALREFDRQRPSFAPNSHLYFQVWTPPGKGLGDLRIAIRKDDRIIELPLDAEAKFSIPPLPSDGWTLVANRGRRRVSIVPVVMSPDTSDANRLLGDLRLQCRVNWALSSPEVSIVVRGMFAAAGGCSGNKFAYYATANHTIVQATAANDRLSKPVGVWNLNKYRVPLGDSDLGNDSRVHLTFAN